ncbi:MAG TPA: hypothetical protein VN688_08475 [Gemmataceae bacterium]|nr:hypothetical protein [Gemmataceae bacterium]
MANPLPVVTTDQTAFQDGNASEQSIAFYIDNNDLRVPKNQVVGEHFSFNWFQQQQAQFAARFLSPSFREG